MTRVRRRRTATARRRDAYRLFRALALTLAATVRSPGSDVADRARQRSWGRSRAGYRRPCREVPVREPCRAIGAARSPRRAACRARGDVPRRPCGTPASRTRGRRSRSRRREPLEVPPRRWLLPHDRVHRRREQHRLPREIDGGGDQAHDVVGAPGGELRQHVHRARGDQHQVRRRRRARCAADRATRCASTGSCRPAGRSAPGTSAARRTASRRRSWRRSPPPPAWASALTTWATL